MQLVEARKRPGRLGSTVDPQPGAQVGQQCVAAGLADEISIHLVPVLFGSGTRMFEHLGGGHVQLETVEVIETPGATHLRYRILHQDRG
jgi:dihydrofolate reductase